MENVIFGAYMLGYNAKCGPSDNPFVLGSEAWDSWSLGWGDGLVAENQIKGE